MVAYWGDEEGNLSRGECVTILIWAQGKTCAICGGELSENQATIDHVWPLSLGGVHGFSNWLLTHKHCNEKKGNKKPTAHEISVLGAISRRLPTRFKGG